jgi:hypothetical protein
MADHPPEQVDREDATEAVEGWFMDGGYAMTKTFWQMGSEILDALTEAGFSVERAAALDAATPDGWHCTTCQCSECKPKDVSRPCCPSGCDCLDCALWKNGGCHHGHRVGSVGERDQPGWGDSARPENNPLNWREHDQ